ncbi:M48 family metallopeptidase [Pelomonas sp. UHG3]|uniref:M48 family metallopeptidase n=1 Tax=Roseateles hydrophilus TaxID=2975054 RepID=A0ACC6CC31_9BURK|nr:M48 family metallopeptidase [Pelomonas sp. UHG3]MCY4746017.1 M48 family metallopeptidase [Pelomonas sp. UHG3]
MAASVQAHWFDGQHGQARPVSVSLREGQLHFADQCLPLHRVQWPERMRHGQRLMVLPGGGVLSFPDAAAFDAWADATGQRPGLVERWQLSWPLAVMALVFISALFAAGWRWGLPWASDELVKRIPRSVEQPVGEEFMAFVDKQWLRPSQLSAAEQAAWRGRFERLLAQARASGMDVPEHIQLHFRRTSATLGPNAFALVGGQMCITDELIALLKDEPDAVLTILAHEVGHLQHRHGLRTLIRASVVTAATSLWLGDFSSFLNGLPVLLATNGYRRDHEREADAFARDMAQRGGVDPARIAVFFERIREAYGDQSGSAFAIAFSSHPADDERIAFFKAEAASAPKN